MSRGGRSGTTSSTLRSRASSATGKVRAYHCPIAMAFDRLGDRGEAIRRMEKALRIYEQIENPLHVQVRAILANWRGERR